MDPRTAPTPSTSDEEHSPDPKSEAVEDIISSVMSILEDVPRKPRKGRAPRSWRGLGWWKP